MGEKRGCLTAAIIVLVFTAFKAASAAGTGLPEYDIDAHCKSVTAAMAPGAARALIQNGCLSMERQWKARISKTLKYFTGETIDRCDKLARMSTGGSYQMLGGCLAMDIANRFFKGEIKIVPLR